MRKLLLALAGGSFLVCGAALHYVIPRVSTVQIVGVEVKRVDGESGSRDVYLIQTQDAGTGEVRVFRNEDALAYLKLDSADLQARAAALSRGDPQRTVAVRHYGWRVPLLSVFPNAISVREVGPDHQPTPLSSAVPLLLYALITISGGLLWSRVRSRRGVGAPSAPAADTGSDPGMGAAGEWLSTNRTTGSGRDEDA